MEIGQKVKVEWNHPSLQSDAIGSIIKVFGDFIIVEFPQNFVYDETGKEKKDYPKWCINPFEQVKKYAPYCSFIGVDKSKIIPC